MDTAPEDYERLVRPLEERMMRIVWGVTQHAQDAEDAIQEALAVLWRRWDRVRRHPNPEALILRICIHSAYDVLRKRMRRERREASARIDRAESSNTPAEALDAKECRAAIREAIGQLSRDQAAAVTMRLVQGLPYGDIGRALGRRETAVRKLVERGRERLRGFLKTFIQHSTEMEGAS